MKRILLSVFILPTIIFGQTFSGTIGLVSDDGAINDFTATASGLSSSTLSTTYGLQSVCLNMNHTYCSDMEILLIAPDNTSITLINGIGGGDDNFTNTCLDQAASTAIISALPPYTGTFKPMGNIGDVNNGQNGNGTWTLRCIDHYGADQGDLLSWSITFATGVSGPINYSSSNLPIVMLNVSGQTIPQGGAKIPATMKIIWNGVGQMNYVTDVPTIYNGDIGIEKRGAFSSSLPQKPYNIETRLPNGLERDTSLLGMPAEHDWVLIANYNDKAFVRNTLAFKLFTEMGHYAPRMQFCEVFLDGQYQGIYLLGEKIKRDKGRVDIAKLDSTENVFPDVSGGYIIKSDYYNGSDSWQSNYSPIDHPGYDVHYVYSYPKPDNITPQQKTYIQTFFDDLETALYSPNFTDSVTGYTKYMSEKSFMDYFIVNEVARNADGFKKSRFYHKDKDSANVIGKLKAGPVWDFDWAWKDIWGCVNSEQTDGSGWSYLVNDCGPDVNSNGWNVRLFQDTSYANRLRCRYENFRLTVLDTSYLFNYIDSVALHLDSAQFRHYTKWGHLGINTGAPEVGPAPLTFSGEILGLKNWITKRLTWLDANMPGNLNNCLFTGVKNNFNSQTNLSVFPNPCTNKINLNINFKSKLNLKIVDLNGKELKFLEITNYNQTRQIDVSFLNPGIYVLTIIGDFINQNVKLVVE